MSEGGQLYERPLGSCKSDTEETVEEACGAAAAAALDTVWLRWGPPSDAAEAFAAGMGCGAGGRMERAGVDAAEGLQLSL